MFHIHQLKVEDREKTSLISKWLWKSWTASCKSMKPEDTLTPCTEISSKWLKDLNIRHDTIKLPEENRSKTFSEISSTNIFLGQSPKAIEIKSKHTNGSYSNLKASVQKRKPSTKWKKATDWEKIFANDATNKGLIYKIYKQLKQLNNNTTTNKTAQQEKGQKT